MKLEDIKSWLLDLLFPPKCVFCQRIIDNNPTCTCRKCETRLPYTSGKDMIFKGEFFDKGTAPFFYRDDVREAVLRFKFYGKEIYADAFGEYMAHSVAENLDLPDVITWVPVSKERRRERGYDQAQLLAKSVASRLEIPSCSLLVKTVDNTTQSSIKDKEARKANVLGVYDITDIQTVNGKKVLLIDDVFTTGATVSECSRMLLTAGAENVSCAVFARR